MNSCLLLNKDACWQHRLGAFRRHRDRERRVRVAPRDEEHGHEFSSVGEVDGDVSEVRFAAVARRMVEWDEGLASVATTLLEVASDLVVAASVFVFSCQSSIDLHRRVTLLRRRERFRLAFLERFEDGLVRVTEFLGDLSDGQSIATALSNDRKMIHRNHPFPLAAASSPHAGLDYDVSLLDADRVSLLDADYQFAIGLTGFEAISNALIVR